MSLPKTLGYSYTNRSKTKLKLELKPSYGQLIRFGFIYCLIKSRYVAKIILQFKDGK